MPTLLLAPPDGPSRPVQLLRGLTTVGSSPNNDIVVPNTGLEPTHLQLRREGEAYYAIGMLRDMTVNGRRQRQVRLQDQDVIRVGELQMTFFAHSEDVPAPPSTVPSSSSPAAPDILEAYRKIHTFSVELTEDAATEHLVMTLLDGVIELTGADRGFLILIEDDVPVIRAARNISQASLDTAIDRHISDTILSRVRESKQPLMLDDACAHEEWSAAKSIVNLKLHSVLCVPLLDRGEVKGLLYVGHVKPCVFGETSRELAIIFAAQASLLITQKRRFDELTKQKKQLESELAKTHLTSIVGACESMKDVLLRIRKVATTDITVLITGETGTGKELIAQELHKSSRRAQGPFIPINCGAIPENLLESELFGHVKGAFTGAVSDRIGRFQAAHAGTIFLDEIGEMPLILQVKLLRVLQEKIVTPIGGTKEQEVDIRIIAATNRNLEKEVEAGRFREDLYYRLDVVNVEVPPLRSRGADVETLAWYFLRRDLQTTSRQIVGFSKPCLSALRKYQWPGNVRELENKIRKAVVMSDGPEISTHDLGLDVVEFEEILTLAEAKEKFQRRYIKRVLERNGGNRTRTARELGVDPRTIFRHLERINASPDLDDRPTSEDLEL